MKYKLRKTSVWIASILIVLCMFFCCIFGKVVTKSEENTNDDYSDIFGYTINELAMYIDKAGTYTLSGLYKGMIYVDVQADESVTVVLSGAEILNEEAPCIYVANSGSFTLEIAENTENVITSGDEVALSSSNINKDAVYGAITFKDDANIEGTGNLIVYGYINNGIHCSNNLSISSGNITVTALNNGIKGNDSLTIENGEISVTACGKGLVSDENITVKDGDITVSSVDDSIHTNNAVSILGGNLLVGSRDDGVHANNSLLIENGSLTVYSSYEGLEGNQITINDGNISITASDDGMNAYGGTSMFGGFGSFGGFGRNTDTTEQSEDDEFEDSTPNLIINGGNIFVDADGDGLDSNGNLIVNGGYIIVDGPTTSANGALDSGTENGGSLLVNGGTLLAIGASGMAESPESESTQCYVSGNISYASGTEIKLLENGETLFSYTATKSGSSVILSSELIQKGNTYTLVVGSSEYEFTASSIANTIGSGGNGNTQWNNNMPGGFNRDNNMNRDMNNRKGR